MSRILRILFTPMNIIGLLLLFGAMYAKQFVSRPPAQPQPPKLQLEEVQPQALTLYFSDKDVTGYVKEVRSVPVQGSSAGKLAQAAVTSWLSGPQKGGLRVVPQGSDSPEVWMRGLHYIVNLPSSYTKLNYGLSGEHMLICSLTRTLLEKTGQDVSFLVGGKNVPSLLGHVDLQRPYAKTDCPDQS